MEENRADFVKRLFAVVVSIGFANQLIQMDWVKNGKWPDGSEGPHTVFLILGLLLIIQSWEGYLAALRHFPLRTETRFYVDIVTVFAYLFLLSISKSVAGFLFVTCIILCLYAVWDFLTFKEYHEAYAAPDESFLSYRKGIGAAVRNPAAPMRYKLSTLIALIWFVELYSLYLQAKNVSPYVYAALALFGLVAYRYDKRWPQHWSLVFAPIVIGLGVLIYLIT